MLKTTVMEGEKKKEVKKGRHYLVHGQRSCPLEATALNRFQVHGQLQLCPFYLATRGVSKLI